MALGKENQGEMEQESLGTYGVHGTVAFDDEHSSSGAIAHRQHSILGTPKSLYDADGFLNDADGSQKAN